MVVRVASISWGFWFMDDFCRSTNSQFSISTASKDCLYIEVGRDFDLYCSKNRQTFIYVSIFLHTGERKEKKEWNKKTKSLPRHRKFSLLFLCWYLIFVCTFFFFFFFGISLNFSSHSRFLSLYFFYCVLFCMFFILLCLCYSLSWIFFYPYPFSSLPCLVSEWVREWVREWVSDWVNEWVSEWMCNDNNNDHNNSSNNNNVLQNHSFYIDTQTISESHNFAPKRWLEVRSKKPYSLQWRSSSYLLGAINPKGMLVDLQSLPLEYKMTPLENS